MVGRALDDLDCSSVFIIDPAPIVRTGLISFFNKHKAFRVCGEARNLEESIKAIEEAGPEIVITGLSFGNYSGVSIVETFVHHFPGTYLLVFSAYDESIYAERCIGSGAQGYVMKTEPAETVICALNKIMKGGIYLSEQIQSKLINKFAHNKTKEEITPIASLSNRELEIFQFMGYGMKTKQIGDKLNLSTKTVGTHIERIKKKMGLDTTREVLMHSVHWMTANHPNRFRSVGETTT